MAPKTLLDAADDDIAAATRQVSLYETALAATRTALTSAESARTTAEADYDAAQTALRETLAAAAEATVPVDRIALLREAGRRAGTVHHAYGALLGARLDAATVGATAEATQEALAAVADAVTAATARRKTMAVTDAQRRAWLDALATAPLAGMKTAATDAADATKEPLKSALDRWENELPAELRDAAEERHRTALANVTRAGEAVDTAEQTLATTLGTQGGLGAATAKAAIAFVAAERAVRDYASGAALRLARGLAVLQRVADTAIASASQQTELSDARFDTDAKPGADAETQRAPKVRDLDDARQALADARLTKAVDDPTRGVPDSAVTAEITAVTTAQGALNGIAPPTTVQRTALLEWAAQLPDAPWATAVAFLDARRDLEALAALDPAVLRAAFIAAEDALATAAIAEAGGARSLAMLRAEVARRDRIREAVDAVRDAFATSAARCDV